MNEISHVKVAPRFRFLEHVDLTYKPFAWKIAIFNTLAFCLITGVDTYKFGLIRMQNGNTGQSFRTEQRPDHRSLRRKDGNTRQCLKTENRLGYRSRRRQDSTIEQHLRIEKGNASQSPKVLNGDVPRCPWDYWILLWAIPLLLGNWWLCRSTRWWFLETWLCRTLSPYLFTVAVGCYVGWINFRPPSPNVWQMLTFALVPLLGLATAVIRYYIPHFERGKKLKDVDLRARIKWIDENSNMWRTLAITSMVPTIVFVMFWYPLLEGRADQVSAPEQRLHLLGWIALQAAGIFVYAFFGPIYECYRKAEHMRNMLLAVKKEKT